MVEEYHQAFILTYLAVKTKNLDSLSNTNSDFFCEHCSYNLFHFPLPLAQLSVSLSTTNVPSRPVSTLPIISQSFGWTMEPDAFNNCDKSLKKSAISSCFVQCCSLLRLGSFLLPPTKLSLQHPAKPFLSCMLWSLPIIWLIFYPHSSVLPILTYFVLYWDCKFWEQESLICILFI